MWRFHEPISGRCIILRSRIYQSLRNPRQNVDWNTVPRLEWHWFCPTFSWVSIACYQVIFRVPIKVCHIWTLGDNIFVSLFPYSYINIVAVVVSFHLGFFDAWYFAPFMYPQKNNSKVTFREIKKTTNSPGETRTHNFGMSITTAVHCL